MKIREEKEELAVGDMNEDLLDRKPLPIGRTQFDEWSDRIIKAAAIEADRESLRFALAAMLLSCPPTMAFREDAYFVLALRKGAVNQTAAAIMEEQKEKQQKELAEKAKLKKEEEAKLAAATGPQPDGSAPGGVLENKAV